MKSPLRGRIVSLSIHVGALADEDLCKGKITALSSEMQKGEFFAA